MGLGGFESFQDHMETTHNTSKKLHRKEFQGPVCEVKNIAAIAPSESDDDDTDDNTSSICDDGGREATNSLMSSSWDATLLSDWNSVGDRINRWMLHALGTDNNQAQTHKHYLAMEFEKHDQPGMSWKVWSRAVCAYWFLDEAATGNPLHENTSKQGSIVIEGSSRLVHQHLTGSSVDREGLAKATCLPGTSVNRDQEGRLGIEKPSADLELTLSPQILE